MSVNPPDAPAGTPVVKLDFHAHASAPGYHHFLTEDRAMDIAKTTGSIIDWLHAHRKALVAAVPAVVAFAVTRQIDAVNLSLLLAPFGVSFVPNRPAAK